MVLRQVGKGADAEVDPVHPMQHQGMGGHLHDRVGAAGVAHSGKQALQFKALRRGAFRLQNLVSHHIADGTDEADLGAAGLFQQGLEQVGHGGLSVGAGHADDLQAA